MYETINEPVKVLVSFFKNRVRPLAFEWHGRRYPVKQVNLIHSARKGEARVYFFSVSDDTNYFRLAFDTKTLEWELQEMYSGGES